MTGNAISILYFCLKRPNIEIDYLPHTGGFTLYEGDYSHGWAIPYDSNGRRHGKMREWLNSVVVLTYYEHGTLLKREVI